MKNIFAITALAVLLLSNSLSAQNQIEWETDFARAQKRASAEKKLILLHFAADWCRPCRNLDTYVFTNPIAADAIRENVIPVKIDVDLHPDKVQEYGVTGVPYDVIITPNGRIMSQRKSPSDASAYVRMIKGKESSVNNLSKEKQSLADDMDQLRSQLVAKRPLAEHNDFQPKGDFAPDEPSHQLPTVSDAGLELARKSGRVVNPFINNSADVSTPMRAVKTSQDFETNRTATAEPVAQSRAAIIQNSSGAVKITNQFFDPTRTTYDPPVAARQPAARQPSEQMQPTRNQTIPNPSFHQRTEEQIVGNEAVKRANVNDLMTDDLISAADSQADFAPAVPDNPMRKFDAAQANNDFAALRKNGAVGGWASESIARPGNTASSAVVSESETSQMARQLSKPSGNDLANAQAPRSFALKGKCPVTLLNEGKWQDGDKKIGCTHRGRTYLFASQEKLTRFQADPDRYSPIMACYDPVAYHDSGQLVDGKEEFGVFMGQLPNQRVVLFSSQDSRDKFQKNPALYIDTVRQARMSVDGASKYR